jgi:hypothetical protein
MVFGMAVSELDMVHEDCVPSARLAVSPDDVMIPLTVVNDGVMIPLTVVNATADVAVAPVGGVEGAPAVVVAVVTAKESSSDAAPEAMLNALPVGTVGGPDRDVVVVESETLTDMSRATGSLRCSMTL